MSVARSMFSTFSEGVSSAKNLVQENKFATGVFCVSVGLRIFEHAWALDVTGHQFPWRVTELLVLPLIQTGMAVAVGHVSDKAEKAKRVAQAYPNSHSTLYNNKFAGLFGLAQFGMSTFTHAWGGHADQSLAWKVAYTAVAPVLHGLISANLGHQLDKSVAIFEKILEEYAPLMENTGDLSQVAVNSDASERVPLTQNRR